MEISLMSLILSGKYADYEQEQQNTHVLDNLISAVRQGKLDKNTMVSITEVTKKDLDENGRLLDSEGNEYPFVRGRTYKITNLQNASDKWNSQNLHNYHNGLSMKAWQGYDKNDNAEYAFIYDKSCGRTPDEAYNIMELMDNDQWIGHTGENEPGIY